jgi:cyclophilin family peptidyl-prolyl cis-trans isomerase
MKLNLLAVTLIGALSLTGTVGTAFGQGAAKPAESKPAEPKPADAKPAETKPAPQPAPQEDKIVTVKMTTSMGDIVLELNQTKAPITVANFLSYVDKGHYNGTIFHRVIGTFMIQGGGLDANLTEKPTDAPIKNEWRNGLTNSRGTIAMARKGGARGADSATSQFFINVVDNPGLDRPQPAPDSAAYCVFGKVVSGMEVVDKIKGVKTGTKRDPRGANMADVPVEPVTIISVTRVKVAEPAKPAEKPAGKP